MPQFQPKSFSDPSNLTHGRHPGFLLAIVEEPIPDGWEMGKKDSLMFRWHLAIWEHPDHMTQYAPEQQSGITSRAFSPKGKFQASRAWVWTCSLLGRELPRGQGADLDPLLPLSCWIDVERIPGNDFAKVKALYGRPEGQGVIPPVVHQLRAQYATGFPEPQANGQAPQQQAPSAPLPPQPPAQPPPATQTAAQPQWGGPGPATQPGWPGRQVPQAQPARTAQPPLPGARPGASVPF